MREGINEINNETPFVRVDVYTNQFVGIHARAAAGLWRGRPDHFQIGGVQVHEKVFAPVFFIELNARSIRVGLSDNRPFPTRFDFNGIVFEPRRCQHRLFYADDIKFVHSVNYRFASRTSISWWSSITVLKIFAQSGFRNPAM